MWITILAYHLVHAIQHELRMSGLNLSWGSIRDIMCTQVKVSAKMNSCDGKTTHIRTVTEPEPEQRKILKALRITSFPMPKEIVVC